MKYLQHPSQVSLLRKLIIITDAAPSANSSTTREIVDICNECKRNGIATHVYAARLLPSEKYTASQNGTYLKPPFYKSQNLILRFISENILGLSLAAKYILLHKNKSDITNVLWISPSIFNIYLAVAIKITSNASIYLALRDMFPHWLVNIGRLDGRSIIYRFLNLIADFQMAISTTIGVESDKSKELFLELYPKYATKCEVLYNWMESEPLVGTEKYIRNPVRFVYAGNLGQAQGITSLQVLLEYFSNSSEVEFHFIGRGEGFLELAHLKNTLKSNNIFLHEPLPVTKIDNFIRQFHIGLVFLRSDLRASNIPGKAMGYLLNGLPVFGSVNPENDLPKIIGNNDLGYIDISGNPSMIVQSAKTVISNYRLNNYSPDSIRFKSVALFSPSTALNKIMKCAGGSS